MQAKGSPGNNFEIPNCLSLALCSTLPRQIDQRHSSSSFNQCSQLVCVVKVVNSELEAKKYASLNAVTLALWYRRVESRSSSQNLSISFVLQCLVEGLTYMSRDLQRTKLARQTILLLQSTTNAILRIYQHFILFFTSKQNS